MTKPSRVVRSLFALAIVSQAVGAAPVVVPSTGCYALDNDGHLVDFSGWVGHEFEYNVKMQEADIAVQFCKDVESRSNLGFVGFGRFDKFNHFTAGSGNIDFVQHFYGGDLKNCEKLYDKLGRTAQVNIICGSCSKSQCKGELGCICNVTYESACRVLVELAITCEKQGPRVFEGFTIGFHPWSWEIVYNGMTQHGFEKSYPEFSFRTEQASVALYMTAISSRSNLVQKPIVQVFPENGLDVKLSGSAMTGGYPTTLSPTTLILDWRCEIIHDFPYEVGITVPVDGYEPVYFTLSKICEHKQDRGADTTSRWAVFGILSCICVSLSTLFCIGGFVYKIRVENQRGIDALPGITVLSACLETVSGGRSGYSRAEEINSAFTNQASWGQPPGYDYAAKNASGRTYGSI